MKPATRQVLDLLRLRGDDGLSPAEARSAIACDRLAARVHELKAAGYDVQTYRERSPMGATFARYVLRERRTFVPLTGVQEALL